MRCRGDEEPGAFMAKGGIEPLILRRWGLGGVVLSWNSDKIELYTDSECQEPDKVVEDGASVAGSRQKTFYPDEVGRDIWDAEWRGKLLWAKASEASTVLRDVHLRLWPVSGDAPPDLVNVTVATLAFKDVKGLYNSEDRAERDPTNGGRVYCNREYDPADPDNTIWTRDKQYVDLEVEVVPLFSDGSVVWEVEDPDDPSDTGMDAASAEIIDPNDYDGSDDDGDGEDKDGGDNTPERDGAPVWEELHSDYALSGNETKIKDGVSKVRFNATDGGGDNFIIKARIKPCGGPTPLEGDETGLMTVWKLIQLENTKMPSGNTLAFANLNSHFEKCFVTWGVQDTTAVSDKDPMGEDEPAAATACGEYVQAPPVGEFERAGVGGWFFMASAGRYLPGSGQQSYPLVDHMTDGNSQVIWELAPEPYAGIIRLPKNVPEEETVDYIFIYNDDGTERVVFRAELIDPDEVLVHAPDYQPEDDPNAHDYKWLADHGFEEDSWIKVDAYSPGELVIRGISPAILEAGNWFFQGRTIIFKFGSTGTMVHELTHGLGMAHMCGNKDHTGEDTCLMTYQWSWLKLESGNLDPWTGWDCGSELCAKHIWHVRRAHLEDDASAKGRRLGW